MPKQKWEISSFTKGIVGSAAEGDIPVDAAAFSLNIDCNTEDGTLSGIKTDTVLSTKAGFAATASQSQTVTILKDQEPDSTKTVATIAEHTDSDTVQINCDSSHGLLSGDVVKFTGTVGSDIDLYDGIHTIEKIDADSFRIPMTFVSSEVTDGTFQIVETSSTLHYKSIQIFFSTVSNDYFLYFDTTEPTILDADTSTGVAVSLGTTHTKTHIAETIKNAITALTDVHASFIAAEVKFTVSCSSDATTPINGACDLFISSDYITIATLTTGHGTPFKADEMVMNHEGQGVYTLIGIDFSDNNILKWQDIYDAESKENLEILKSNVIHNNVSTMQSRNKAIHIGLGYGAEFNTQWIGKIDREQLSSNQNGWFISNDKLEAVSTDLSPLNFDIMCATPIYDNNTAFDVKQSYHVAVSGLNATAGAAANLVDHIHDAAGVLYTAGNANINHSGKTANSVPKIGFTFKITDTNDTADAKLVASKLKSYNKASGDTGTTVGQVSLFAGDIFMIVDVGAEGGDPAAVLEYIGNTEFGADASGDSLTGEAGFIMAAQEGSTILYKISTTMRTDTDAGLTNGGRFESVDLAELLDDASGISSIQQCRSPLVSGHTTANALYYNSGDETVDKDHISRQYCRALHGVYWVGCYSGRLYRINTMDFHSQHSNDTYKGIKLDALMQLDYGEIGKSDTNEGNTGKFKHWYGSIVGADGFFHPYGSNYDMNISSSDVSSSITQIDEYSSTWQAKPRDARISSIIETWMNNPDAAVATNAEAGRYAYDDDSDRDGTGGNVYPAAGHMNHHHAEEPATTTDWVLPATDTMKVTSATGTDVGQILTGYIDGDGSGNAAYEGNTIVNRVRGKTKFDVVGTHTTSNIFPFYSCKVWVLFTKNDSNDTFKKWEMMLFNFYPVTGTAGSKVLMYDRTPPYDEVDLMESNIPDGYHYEESDFTKSKSLPVQKSSMIFGRKNQSTFDSQSSSFGGSSNTVDQPSEFGIIRRDGSCVHYSTYGWSNSFNNTYMTGANHHQFGFHIGFNGTSTGTQGVREIKTIPNTLVSNIARNSHIVRFAGELTGEWCVNGMSHADRRTAGADRINLGWGSFHDVNKQTSIFMITDNASAVDDTRCYAAYYEEHDTAGDGISGINQQLDHHYSDGGRFKSRRHMGSSYDDLDGSDLDDYSTYDGTSLTNKTIPYVNGAIATVYHGQIGDFLYIDRKWLSSEPQTGTTSKRLLGNSAEYSAYRYLPWHNSGSYGTIDKTKNGSAVRFYEENGNMRLQSRGIGSMFTNTSGCRSYYGYPFSQALSASPLDDAYQAIPGGVQSNHAASCRQNQMMISLPKGDSGLHGSTAGTGYNVTSSSSLPDQLYDLNRYAPSWEIVHPSAATFDILTGDDSEFDTIRKMDELRIGSSYRTFTSSMKMISEDGQAMISTLVQSSDEYFDNNTGGSIEGSVGLGSATLNPYHHQGSNGSSSSVYRLVHVEHKKSFTTTPKLVSVPLITYYATDEPTDTWGKFWCAGYMPSTDSDAAITNSQIQFIAPLGTDQYDISESEFDDIASIADYTKSNSFISLVSGVSGLIREFPAGANIRYKVSLLYDEYQESPLSSFFYDFDQAADMETMSTTIRLDANASATFSPRVSHLVIYRRNNVSDMYRMVKEISLKPEDWELATTGTYTNTFIDKTRLGSYEALTGISEGTKETSLNYELSCQLNDYLFVAKAYHSELKEDGEKNIFRSKSGKYSLFEAKKDFISLPTIPTAIVGFNGKLYAFDRSNTYRIDPNSMIVEDIFNGIGCLSPSSISVTEYGMCFADANNIYLHDSTKPTPIAANIVTLAAYQGFDIGWQKAVKKSEKTYNTNPLVVYDGQSNSFVCLVLGSCEQNCNPYVSRAWVYNIMKNRWDYWEAPKSITAVHGDDGNILLTDGNFLYNYRNGTTDREWKWMSKKITAGKETSNKIFHKISFTGNISMNTISTPPKWNDDIVVYLDGNIQQLTLMNTKYIKSFSSCFFNGGAGGVGTSITATDSVLYITGLNAGAIGGELPSIDSYIMLDDEIMLVTGHASASSLNVTRAQLGTTAAIHTSTDYESTEGLENQRLYNIAPCIKLPSKCKGKNLQVKLQNQKGTVGSMGIDLIVKHSGR